MDDITAARERFETGYIVRHLQDLPYREAKAHCEALRNVKGYIRQYDEGHLDDCWMAFQDNQR